MAEILSKQKQFLIESIGEAKTKEFQRLKRLQNVSSKSEKNMLITRFEKERVMDQVKIQQLSSDLLALKEKVSNGDMQQVKDHREGRVSSRPIDTHNRFAGIEDHNQIIFHTDVVNKFNKHDRRFAAKQSRVAFNPIEERQKLNLLDSKRVLLKQLITIQAAEMNANGQHVTSSGRNYSARDYDTCSIASSRSSASYATFASSTGGNKYGGGGGSNPVRRNVPALSLGRISEL